MKNIKIFAFLAIFLLSAAVSTAWAKDVTLTYKISVTGTIPHAYITNADGKTVCDWRNGIKTLWPANEEHSMNDGYGITFTPDQDLDKTDKNENKKSTSTTAFRTEENTIFTVSVGQGFYFKSVTFKEDDVEKASSSNIAPNSTSISVSVPKNKFFNYITVVLTNDFHYIDENGKEQIRKPGEYTVLTSLTDVSNLGGGWYVVQGEVSYGNSVNFSGDAHLILADGATLEIETEGIYGIYASNNLTIYGQNGQSGTLKVTATGTGGYGIYSYSGDITINGGSVTATGKEYGIYSRGGNITLGWTNSTDFIKVSSIHLGVDSCTVSIAEGKSFKDEDGNVYSGMLTGEQLSAIKSKKLEPCYAVTFDAQNGDDPIMLLTTFDENGVAHVKKPNDPIRSGFTFEGWFTAKDGNTEFDFTKAVTENTTAYAHWNENTPVEYIDENGGTKKTQNYILLTNGINVDNLPGGWYVVEGEVKYTSQVTFNGDAHLILADDATIEIKSEDFGIYANENLTIYGQGGQSGTLNVTALDEIGGTSSSSTGVFSAGNITINGGSVTATSTNGVGIYSDNGVTISGGSVTAYGYYDGIYSYNGGVTISGGSVTATGNY
ncbi:InlB B-repeat-containing protein, partial [uncultured Fibrobacter sp.]|uniref:InlB B-repeat-containing protein n=1 Tax=uncultured Fibrobacter sp. TaxID=261512 RepID=UPI0026158F3A